jgi:acyl dehydratase
MSYAAESNAGQLFAHGAVTTASSATAATVHEVSSSYAIVEIHGENNLRMRLSTSKINRVIMHC